MARSAERGVPVLRASRGLAGFVARKRDDLDEGAGASINRRFLNRSTACEIYRLDKTSNFGFNG